MLKKHIIVFLISILVISIIIIFIKVRNTNTSNNEVYKEKALSLTKGYNSILFDLDTENAGLNNYVLHHFPLHLPEFW